MPLPQQMSPQPTQASHHLPWIVVSATVLVVLIMGVTLLVASKQANTPSEFNSLKPVAVNPPADTRHPGCDQPYPGYLTISFTPDISPQEAREFMAEQVFAKDGFSEQDLVHPWDATLADLESDIFLDERRKFYGEEQQQEFRFLAEIDKYGSLITVADQLAKDPRVAQVRHHYFDKTHPTFAYNSNARLFLIDFKEGASVAQFTTDHPEVVPFPDYIEVRNNDYLKQQARTPTSRLFIYRTLADDVAFVEQLKQAVEVNPADHLKVQYGDYDFFQFSITFPPSYSATDIRQLVDLIGLPPLAEKQPFDQFPFGVYVTIQVPVGSEVQWRSRWEQQTSVIKKVSQPIETCMEIQ